MGDEESERAVRGIETCGYAGKEPCTTDVFVAKVSGKLLYLVEEHDGLTLGDAALPYSVKGILQAARQIGKPITRIVLTHAHANHVGALDALKRALPDGLSRHAHWRASCRRRLSDLGGVAVAGQLRWGFPFPAMAT